MSANGPTEHGHTRWTRSSYSTAEGAECVEVAHSPTALHVRDSKNPTGPQLHFPFGAWLALLRATP